MCQKFYLLSYCRNQKDITIGLRENLNYHLDIGNWECFNKFTNE